VLGARQAVAYAATRARSVGRGRRHRDALTEEFLVTTAAHAASELGQMKGVVMKVGQLLSVIGEGLPDEAQAALATLQSDAPPLPAGAAEALIEHEFGRRVWRRFDRFDAAPTAAASIGQVHRARLVDGREVAVKVQYPGLAEAMQSDLDNAERLYQLLSMFALKGLDARALTDELRRRMLDELDYRSEAANQRAFAERFRAHPFIRIPTVVDELSTSRVLVTEWAEGMTWSDFESSATADQRQAAAEVVFRFGQACIYRHRSFNGDPHPGNYRFHADGTVTFLDFGLVKTFTDGEVASLWPLIDPLLAGDEVGTAALMVQAGFLPADHGLDPRQVYAYVSAPYRPYLSDEFTFTRAYVAETLRTILDVKGPHAAVVAQLNMPASFVILDRVIWGMSALLGRLEAHNRWRAILDEYRIGADPATERGEVEADWARRRGMA